MDHDGVSQVGQSMRSGRRGGLDGPGQTEWRANFHRVIRNQKVGPLSWSPGGESWHDTRAFGRLVFE